MTSSGLSDRPSPGLSNARFRAVAVVRDVRFAVPLLYAVAGFTAYALALRSSFIADDFLFLDTLQSGGRWNWPRELPGTVLRPVSMLSFQVDHALWGLSAFGYHLTNIILHVLNGLLLFAITRRLTGRLAPAVWTGLLFIVFAGHAEAVSWIAARADVIAPFWALTCLWLYGNALDRSSGRGLRLMGAYAAFGAAVLSKESAVTIPALAAGLEIFSCPPGGRRRWALGAVLRLGGFAAVLAGYFAIRASAFGSPIGTYPGYNPAVMLHNLRPFLYRSLFPASAPGAKAYMAGYDVWAYALIGAIVAFLAWRRRSACLAFPVAVVLLTLLPVLPFSVSVVDSESERLIYLPSAGGAMLLMMLIAEIAPTRRWPTQAVAATVCAVHLVLLVQINQRFLEASRLCERIISSFGEVVGAVSGADDAAIFILNGPDTYRGVYVFRNGLLQALKLFEPQAYLADRRPVFGVVGHSTSSLEDRVTVQRIAPASFRVDLGSGRIPYPPLGSSVFFTIGDQSSSHFEIAFTESVGKRLVLYITGGRIAVAGIVEGLSRPFGVVDIPASDALCEGETMRFAGWALDNREVVRVAIARAPVPGVDRQSPDQLIELAQADWMKGERVDVERTFPSFPHADRAGWTYSLPCSALPSDGRAVAVHVIAYDGDGLRTDLGVRSVRRR